MKIERDLAKREVIEEREGDMTEMKQEMKEEMKEEREMRRKKGTCKSATVVIFADPF